VSTGLFVYTSNRLEELLEALATVLRQSPLPPLQDETIVVPSQGLSRWLRQQLAQRCGIAAGLQLPFPGAFVQQLDQRRVGAGDPFAPDPLLFRLWRLFDDSKLRALFGPAAAYCEHDPDQQKRLQLLQRLVRCFDDYQLYRPELLQQWSAREDTPAAGPHAAWQAQLWRELLRDAGLLPVAAMPEKPRGRRRPAPTGPLLFPELGAVQPPTGAANAAPDPLAAQRFARLQQALADGATARALQPVRLSVFGAGTLPPAFLELLATLSQHLEVHLFVPTPTALFTGDVHRLDPDSNALFARLGTEAREFATLLARTTERLGAQARLVVDLGELAARPAVAADAPLLLRLQDDIAALRVRGPDRGPLAQRLQLRADDDSLRVHVCHSPQRELEVVRDQILAAFAADPELSPDQVLVLVPDIERYAPFAHAVFGPVQDHLPFHVADKSPAKGLPLCTALFAVLQLAHERLEVHDVLHLLEQPAVQQRFRIFANDLPSLRTRCERAGIRWGLDGEARARQFQVPPFDDNAWRPGLDRLLLGTATGPVHDLVLGQLPVADATSGRDELLLRFLHFTDTLWAQLIALQQPQPPAQWALRIEALLAAMFAPASAEDEQALTLVRAALAKLRSAADVAHCRAPLHRTVLRDWLEQALRQQPSPRGFLAGAVTIAALLPMRAVPVQRLYVCGLDDASFPRRDTPPPFDLVAQTRRPGDRSARLDDRQMFLDVLLAARESLHLCYVGRSQKDNSACAPSVVLGELLDHLDLACERLPDGRLPREAIVVEHPLQPWSVRYRQTGARRDPRLFTFTRAELEPELLGTDEPAWCTGALTTAAESTGAEVPFDRLLEFWRHPSRFFLRHGLGLRLPREDEPDATMEPFAVGNLQRWALQSDGVERALRGTRPPRDPEALMRASGRLPIGGMSKIAFVDVDDELQKFLTELRSFGALENRLLDVPVGPTRVRGELSGIARECLVLARIASIKPKDHLRAWLHHVFMALARHRGGADWPAVTALIGKGDQWRLRELPADIAEQQAELLLRGCRDGLPTPLPFFELASHKFGERLHDGKDRDEAMRAARRAFQVPGREAWMRSDSEDAAVALCWRGRDPLDQPAFAAFAEQVWTAIHAYTEAS
jgi:exodeoxyribonuclease V gamma subunit